MDWDVRHWSIFIFFVALVMTVMAISTPYQVLGDPVYFGSQGLWKVDSDPSGHYKVTLTLLLVSAVLLTVALVCFIILLQRVNTLTHILTIGFQVLGGVFNLAAVGHFAVHEKKLEGGLLETGFWLALSSGIIFILNAIFLVSLPFMEDDLPRRRMSTSNQAKSRV